MKTIGRQPKSDWRGEGSCGCGESHSTTRRKMIDPTEKKGEPQEPRKSYSRVPLKE